MNNIYFDIVFLLLLVVFCEGHQEKVSILQFHPQAKSLLASAGYDCKLLLWDLSSRSVALSLEDTSEPVLDFCFCSGLDSGYCFLINSSFAWHGVLMELNWQHLLKITLYESLNLVQVYLRLLKWKVQREAEEQE